jgi:hypothetical protein
MIVGAVLRGGLDVIGYLAGYLREKLLGHRPHCWYFSLIFFVGYGGRTRVRTWDPLIKSGQFGYFSTFHLVQRCFNFDCYQIVVDLAWLVMVHSVA